MFFGTHLIVFVAKGGAVKESQYQASLIDTIKSLIPGCMILKTDPKEIQGIPDLIILFRDKWAMLEVKISGRAKVQPNQQYYIDKLGEMSYCSFISPDNEGEVLDELQQAFGLTG